MLWYFIFNETIEYDITNEESARFLEKNNYYSNYRQNTININWDHNKYWTRECCRAYIRSERKGKPHENTARVSLTWTILQMEINSDFNKKWVGVGEEGFYPSHGGGRGLIPHPTSTPPTPC